MAHNIIITGSCCSGKTTLLELLKPFGYIIDEAARYIIKHAQNDKSQLYNSTCVPWVDFSRFQHAVLDLQKTWEDEAIRGHLFYFHDRGAIDSKGYTYAKREELQDEQAHQDIIDKALAHARRREYHKKIFLCEPLPLKNDKERKETPEEQMAIHTQMINAYKNANFEIHLLGKDLCPQGRLEQVLSNLPTIQPTVANLISYKM